MSYRPTIGGSLRKRTSGVDRSQAALFGLWIERHHEAQSDLE
jgi:hypothetical protein